MASKDIHVLTPVNVMWSGGIKIADGIMAIHQLTLKKEI